MLIIGTAAAATIVKLYLAYTTNGSLDVLGFEDWRDKIQALGILGTYHVIGKFNNPFNHTPFLSHFLTAIDYVSGVTHLPFKFWLRVPAILADVGSLVIVKWILDHLKQPHPAALLLMAACPISIFVSGFHGQFDPVMIFFLVLSIYLIETQRPLWLAGIAFGLSMSIKVVPVVFVPVMLFYLPSWRARLTLFGSAALFFVVAAMPYIAQEPLTMTKAMFGYGSIYGAWGWTRILVWISGVDPHINGNIYALAVGHALIARIGRYVLLIAILVTSFVVNRAKNKPPLFIQCGMIAYLFMFLTPGYGVQYQSWLVPWTVAVGLRPQLIYYVVAGIYLGVEYLCWALWDSFPSICVPYKMWVLGLACWLSIFIVMISYLRFLKEFQLKSQDQAWTK